MHGSLHGSFSLDIPECRWFLLLLQSHVHPFDVCTVCLGKHGKKKEMMLLFSMDFGLAFPCFPLLDSSPRAEPSKVTVYRFHCWIKLGVSGSHHPSQCLGDSNASCPAFFMTLDVNARKDLNSFCAFSLYRCSLRLNIVPNVCRFINCQADQGVKGKEP